MAAHKHQGDIRPPGRKRLLSDEQRLNWLRLIRSENVGPTTFRELINHFGGSAQALEALPRLSQSGGGRGRIKICSLNDAEVELKRAVRAGASLVALGEPDYPAWLAAVDAPRRSFMSKANSSSCSNPWSR